VTGRICLEELFRPNSPVNLGGRYFALLCDAVRNDDRSSAVKEVQHPVMDTLIAGSQLIDPTAEIISFRAPELVAQIFQSLQACQALLLGSFWQTVKPLDQRRYLIRPFLEENYGRSWQTAPPLCSHNCERLVKAFQAIEDRPEGSQKPDHRHRDRSYQPAQAFLEGRVMPAVSAFRAAISLRSRRLVTSLEFPQSLFYYYWYLSTGKRLQELQGPAVC